MNNFVIKYGGADLTLSKSDQFVAVQAAAGRDEDLKAAVEQCGGTCTGQRYNGFELVNLASSPEGVENGLDEIRDDSAVSVGTHVFHTSSDGVPFVPTGELYVEFTDKASPRDCQRLVDQYAMEVVESRDARTAILRVTNKSPNPLKVAAAFQKSAHVAIAEPELVTPARLFAFTLPNDALLEQQWHLRNSGMLNGSTLGLKTGADARVIAAWEHAETLGNRDVIVAVIDDGFDLDHPDLSGPGKTVAPWDFTRNNDNPRPGIPAWDSAEQEWVGDWHGTACAGVAIGNAQGSGIVGAAPACRLMPIRWGANLADHQIENWFEHARVQGASVVSCSWGAAARVFRLSTRAFNAIQRCATQGRNGLGCVICFAAGNDDCNIDDPNNDAGSPGGSYLNGFALHPDVIAVAACTSRDEKSHYSNYGEKISICAPSSGAGGHGILTSDVMGTFIGNGQVIEAGYSAGAFTSSFGGTSSATPLVAGIAAYLLSLSPALTAPEVKTLLQETARRIGPASEYGSNGHSPKFGYGCVNAEAAVKRVTGATPTRPTTTARKRAASPRRSRSAQR